MFGETVHPQNAGVLECLQKLELAQGSTFNGFAIFGQGAGVNEVKTDAPLDLGELSMGGLPVLVARPFTD